MRGPDESRGANGGCRAEESDEHGGGGGGEDDG